jgi:Tfp pilus assembly protein PilF
MKRTLRRPAVYAVLIAVVTIVVYIPAIRGGFVFDDQKLIVENDLIKTRDGLYRFWFTTQAADYYPLTSSLWWLQWRLWGANPVGYHVVNVLLHAVNAILVWMILRGLKIPGAWLAGLVFAVHPVNVASVAWISEFKNTLSMLLFLTAIELYLAFDENQRWRFYGLSLVAFLLALFSKTAVVMLPIVLLGCVWWRRGRRGWNDVVRSAPFFVLSLVMGLVTLWYQYNPFRGEAAVRTEDFISRLAAAGWLPWFYLSKAVLPLDLCMIYPKWDVDGARVDSWLPGIGLVSCFALFWYKRRMWGRPSLFALGYFVVMLFPVLNLLQQGPYRLTSVADRWDHWQYYSIVAPIALVVGGFASACSRMGPRGRVAQLLASLAVVAALGAATWVRAGVFGTAERLWRDTLAKNPNSLEAHNSLGNVLVESGRFDEAIQQFEYALRLRPNYANARNNLGVALARSGKTQEAVALYELALQVAPDFAAAHNNLGEALFQLGKTQEAIVQWQEALRIDPGCTEARSNLMCAGVAH